MKKLINKSNDMRTDDMGKGYNSPAKNVKYGNKDDKSSIAVSSKDSKLGKTLKPKAKQQLKAKLSCPQLDRKEW